MSDLFNGSICFCINRIPRYIDSIACPGHIVNDKRVCASLPLEPSPGQPNAPIKSPSLSHQDPPQVAQPTYFSYLVYRLLRRRNGTHDPQKRLRATEKSVKAAPKWRNW